MQILKIENLNLDEVVRKSARAIKSGQVIICPTDTVYGLICNASDKKTVSRLFKIKKRPANKPIPIFVKDIKMAKKIAEISKKQEAFLKKAWPGALTAVLKSKKNKGTIGIRIPNYKFILTLIDKLNLPLAETSVNISGEPSLIKIKEILRHFEKQKHQPDLVLNAGNLPKSKPSKVLDLTVWPYKILRS